MGESAMNRYKADVSVVVVNFNTRQYLFDCLSSVYASDKDGLKIEVLVSDNGSADGSADMVRSKFPSVILIQNGANIGYAKANNAAIKIAGGRYILLLNSDTQISPDALKKTVSFMDSEPQVAALTCRVLLSDGRLDPACHRGFPTPWAAFTYF